MKRNQKPALAAVTLFAGAGVFALNAHFAPSFAADGGGFRCAR